MLLYNLLNYADFKEIFVREDGQRKNGILLEALKTRTLVNNPYYGKDFRGCRNMSSLMCSVRKAMVLSMGIRMDKNPKKYRIEIPEQIYAMSDKYYLDEENGICEDRDCHSIRYVNAENGRVMKMKFGKFLRKLLEENDCLNIVPEKVLLWYIEEANRSWEAYALQNMPPVYTFHCEGGTALNKIYDEENCKGDFNSCMSHFDGGRHGDFYRYSTDAKAAWLEDEQGYVVARCVVFTNVEDCETGEIYRIAERQYSTDMDDKLKRLLVNELIKNKLIDAYKRVGADCHSPHNFVGADGSDWSGKNMKIRCDLDGGDVNAYLDSFKYYDQENRVAYNDDGYNYSITLDSTEDYFEGAYDDYYDDYCRETDRAMRDGREYQIDIERLQGNGNWIWVDSADCYMWYEDVCYCSKCDAGFVSGEGYYSDVTGEEYCCEDCMEAAEQEYKEQYWYFSTYDDDYYENEDDVTTWVNSDGEVESISVESLNALKRAGKVIEMFVSESII